VNLQHILPRKEKKKSFASPTKLCLKPLFVDAEVFLKGLGLIVLTPHMGK